MLSYYSTEKGDKASQQEKKINGKDKREREKYSAELGLN
jgi:hypothetical protein